MNESQGGKCKLRRTLTAEKIVESNDTKKPSTYPSRNITRTRTRIKTLVDEGNAVEAVFKRSPAYTFGHNTMRSLIPWENIDKVNPGVLTYRPEKLLVLKKSPRVVLSKARRFNSLRLINLYSITLISIDPYLIWDRSANLISVVELLEEAEGSLNTSTQHRGLRNIFFLTIASRKLQQPLEQQRSLASARVWISCRDQGITE
eukprot:TRINITY_DN8467_c0_g1_i8.p1 TRINITY_DN8467_c0_g1~~TRINITY_DN8467_c0_g1_i8.p1  ORF type:complete len:203 (-),score=3.13 TRINITY_DN8467_c0_g1_i8:238-846(-)